MITYMAPVTVTYRLSLVQRDICIYLYLHEASTTISSVSHHNLLLQVSLSPLHQRHRDSPFLKHPPGREKRDSVPSMSQFSPRLTQQDFYFSFVPFPLRLLLQRFFTHSLYYSVLPILAHWRDKRLAAQLLMRKFSDRQARR